MKTKSMLLVGAKWPPTMTPYLSNGTFLWVEVQPVNICSCSVCERTQKCELHSVGIPRALVFLHR